MCRGLVNKFLIEDKLFIVNKWAYEWKFRGKFRDEQNVKKIQGLNNILLK